MPAARAAEKGEDVGLIPMRLRSMEHFIHEEGVERGLRPRAGDSGL